MPAPMNFEDRIKVFQNIISAEPRNELAHFSLGRLYAENGDLDKAEKSLRTTLELNPKHSVAMRYLGQILLDSGRREEAIELLKKGVVVAHEVGEYQPRNQMQELLRSLGVEPPDPIKEARARPRPAAAAGSGAWICNRCGKENPRIAEAPFDSDIGKKIQASICVPCWREWMAMSIKVINEYRLNLATERGQQVYDQAMAEFLGLGGGGSGGEPAPR